MQDEPSSYQIRLKGHLSPQWATYFDGFTLTNSENGEALLTGVITDQAALHGVLAKIRDLGLPLLSVNNITNGREKGTGMTTSQKASNSKHEIDSLTSDFFRAVSFFEGNKPAYQNLYTLFIESGQLIKNSAVLPEISNLRQFIEPRQSIVDAGELTDFKEVETAEITEIFGNIAHRFSTYEKYGINKGAAFEGRGIISMQFIMTETGWKISSMVWDDERSGLTIPDRYK